MGLSIIVGGQYGSEGKGKVAAYIARDNNSRASVRVGGPNSGHTVYDDDGNKHVLRMLPSATVYRGVDAIIPAGAYIDLKVLLAEIEEMNIPNDRLYIDPNAVIIEDVDKANESGFNLRARIGSTVSGTGMALIRRIGRPDNLLMARAVPELQPYIHDTKSYMRSLIDMDYNIIIEGTQGYGLSNYHSKDYPYVTARDTTAAGFLSETGLSPLDVEQVVMVIRAFPIRVGGNSGPLKHETDWESVAKNGGFDKLFCEYTSVTKNIRRVAEFDPSIVKEAITANNPNLIVLNHVDYVDANMESVGGFTDKQISFIRNIEYAIQRKVHLCGYAPHELTSSGW